MVSNLTSSSYQVFYLSSIERDRFKASISPYDLGTKIDIPISSMKLFEPRLQVSDFEVGDLLKVKLKSQAGDFKSKPFFSSVEYKTDSSHLYILPAGFRPATIPLTSFGDLSERLPRVGKLKIFHRNGEIIMIKLGFKIIKLKNNVTAPIKKVVYITDIDSTKITTCDKLDYTGQYSVISLSNLKRYNQSWTISDLAKWDRIEIKYDSSSGAFSYKLLLSPTQVTRYGDTYQFNISNFGMKAMTAAQLGDIAAAYLSSGMSNLKVLHTSGNIRAFLYNKIIIRVPKLQLTSSQVVSRGEEIKTPKGNSKINLPTNPDNRSAANEACKFYSTPQDNNLSKVSTPMPNHSRAQSDYSSDSDTSISNLSVTSNISTTNFSNTYTLSRESNKRIHISEVRKHFSINEAKFQELHSVFRHGRLFMKEKFGYFKAIGVGYLDHLCRKSTHPNVLNHFISNLQSNSGLYQLNLQTKESRNILILMLNSLTSERSIDSLEDYYIHPDFMEAYIKELQNITYNKMIEERVHANLLECFRNNTLEPKEFLRFIGNALGVIIFTHSLHACKPKFFKSENYSLVINLILKRNHAACLLYYNYLNGEDVNATTNKDKYRCKKCGSLPHEAYFANIKGDLCQRCHVSSVKSGDLKDNTEESHPKQGQSQAKHGRRRNSSRHIKDSERKTKKHPAQSRGISPALQFKPEEPRTKKQPEEIQRHNPIVNHDQLSKHTKPIVRDHEDHRRGPKPKGDKPSKKYTKAIQEPNPVQISIPPAVSPQSVPSSKIPQPKLPTKVSQLPQALIHECDGCKVPTPINLLHKYCDSNHILCEKCVIISNKKHGCISCEFLISTSQASQPSSIKLCSLCSQRNPAQNLECRHSLCTTCIQNHITGQIFNTPLSTHIQAGEVRISCPVSGCGESISKKIFYPLIPPNILDTYKSILSLLPTNNCPKCNLSKPKLTDLGCHKICKNCVLNYFDVKLKKREINFGCMMGCEHSFTAQELNKLMNDKQRAKYQKIRGGDQPGNQVKQCPGCDKEYYKIAGYYKFECKKCDSKFCGACGTVWKFHGQRRKGGHQTTCKFYRA